jgi:L-asparagine transporter-like permease
VSRWLTIAGLVSALILMFGSGIVAWAELLFPVWILALSIDILIGRSRASSAENPGTRPSSGQRLA